MLLSLSGGTSRRLEPALSIVAANDGGRDGAERTGTPGRPVAQAARGRTG